MKREAQGARKNGDLATASTVYSQGKKSLDISNIKDTQESHPSPHTTWVSLVIKRSYSLLF